jgi:hypothetical protein
MKDLNLAKKPPMGWNSWDAYLHTVNEAQFLENAEVMARRLKPFGWETMVIDGGGMGSRLPAAHGAKYDPLADMDENGRYRPSGEKFPSSTEDRGLLSVANKIHALGLKFGIHMLRGVPRTAVEAKLPILGTTKTCAEIADKTSTCSWNNMMYGVRADLPESQAWYDSQFKLYASWNVDFVKMDDMSSPYHKAEVEMVAKAAMRCGRPMVISLSPGDTSPADAMHHVREFSHMWRISGDFWDKWTDLRRNMDRLALWAPLAREGAWPDADMIPLGNISAIDMKLDPTRLTGPEQRALITLWCVARSPLMLGTHLPTMDEETFKLLSNREVIEINQNGRDPREIYRDDQAIVWQIRVKRQKYVAIFGIADNGGIVSLDFKKLGLRAAKWRDVWTGQLVAVSNGTVSVQLEAHGCLLLRQE